MSTKQPDISATGKFGGVALMCVLALLSGCDKQSDDAPILIKFPHVTAPATPKGRAAERFREVVEERLAGRFILMISL